MYLYNTNKVPSIPDEVIVERLRLLEIHLGDLMEVHYEYRDLDRIRDVLKAMGFWSSINKGLN